MKMVDKDLVLTFIGEDGKLHHLRPKLFHDKLSKEEVASAMVELVQHGHIFQKEGQILYLKEKEAKYQVTSEEALL